MNVYRFELRRCLSGAVLWTAVLLSVLAVFMMVIFPIYSGSRSELEAALKGFPPQFAAAFGLSVSDIFSYGGFYTFGNLYLTLLGGIMAATFGIAIFGREKRVKCTDFLMTKPQSRSTVFFAKLFAVLTVLIGANLLYLILSVFLYGSYGEDQAKLGNAVLAASAIFFTQIVMLAVSVFLAVFLKRIRSVSGMATAVGFAGFLLTALQNVLEEDALLYMTPYKYFDVSLAFREGRFEPQYIVTACIVIIVLFEVSYLKYYRSDVHAV